MWKCNRKNGVIVAVVIYKKRYGRKGIGMATDGSAAGKRALTEIFQEDLKRSWVECSGAVEKILLRTGGEKYVVPAVYAETLTGKKCTPSEDGKHYTRTIAGHDHEKIILGTPEGIHIERDVAKATQSQLQERAAKVARVLSRYNTKP